MGLAQNYQKAAPLEGVYGGQIGLRDYGTEWGS